MSDANANQTGSPSPEPPPLVPTSGGSNRLVPGQKLSPRRYRSVAPEVVGLTTAEKDVFGAEGTNLVYSGQALVDANGVIVRDQYSEDDAMSELARFTAAERFAFLRRLQALGMYGNSAPSTRGFSNRDISAMREALRTANAYGYTVDVAMTMLAADPTFKKNPPKAALRTTPKDDLRAVFKQATGTILGRQLSDAEVDKFVRSYQGMEVTEAMGGAAAPSAAVAAQQAVEAAAPEEAAAMGALRLAELMDRRIKELA